MSAPVDVPAVDLIAVELSVEGRIRWQGTVTLTPAEYTEWCERIDSARGCEQERVSEELMDLARIDVMRDMDIESMRVDDFCELRPRKKTTGATP